MTTQPTRSHRPLVVVGVDGSEESRTALRWAVELGRALDADVEALAVWHSPAIVFGPPPIEFLPAAEHRAEKQLTATVDAVFGPDRPRRLRLLVREGHPAELLAARSHTATMLVVGCRGLGAIKGLTHGSVSRYLTEHAVCPVVVVHAGDDINDGQRARVTAAAPTTPGKETP